MIYTYLQIDMAGPLLISATFGRPEYPIRPIWGYKRASNLKSTHTTPEEAVRLGQDLSAKTLVPMHWGTLVLSYEPPFEPPVRFLKAGLDAGFSEDRLWKMAVGETRVLV